MFSYIKLTLETDVRLGQKVCFNKDRIGEFIYCDVFWNHFN